MIEEWHHEQRETPRFAGNVQGMTPTMPLAILSVYAGGQHEPQHREGQLRLVLSAGVLLRGRAALRSPADFCEHDP